MLDPFDDAGKVKKQKILVLAAVSVVVMAAGFLFAKDRSGRDALSSMFTLRSGSTSDTNIYQSSSSQPASSSHKIYGKSIKSNKKSSSKSSTKAIPSSSPSPVPSLAYNILINEIQLSGKTSPGDEFVELYNPNDIAVDLNGWFLKKKTVSGAESILVAGSVFRGAIPPNGFFLVAPRNGYSGQVTPDLYYSGASYSIAKNNTILLYNKSGELSDKVGMGTAADFETADAPNPVNGQSIERKLLNNLPQDTDDNFQDFELEVTSTPNNSGIGTK